MSILIPDEYRHVRGRGARRGPSDSSKATAVGKMVNKCVPAGLILLAFGTAAPSMHAAASERPLSATYASLANLPDWSGTWVMSDREFQASGKISNKAPYKPAYLQTQRDATSDTGKPNAAKCLPSGMPGIMGVPLGFEFVFSPGRVTILTEEGPMIRRIYTDGRKHADDPVPTYAGDSIGHWEGSVLMVDTVAITPKAEFIKRVKTSGQTHVIERIYLVDHDHLRLDTTIEDPLALDAPWSYSWTYERSNTGFVESYYCDDDRDANGEPDLTPPPVHPPSH